MWPVFLSAGIIACFLLYIFVKYNYDTKVVQKDYPAQSNTFNLHNRLKSIPKDELVKNFPWKDYLDSANWRNITCIKESLAQLDSFSGDAGTNREMLSGVLTNKLSAKWEAKYNNYNPDSLLNIVQWAEDFRAYAQIDPGNDIFYESVVSYWLSYVTNKLAHFSQKKGSIKYSFKYKYLVARCHELKFTTPVKVSKTEKVLENLTAGKWAHLTDASWNQTSLLQKLVFLALMLITGYGYYLIITKIIKKWKK